MRPMQYQMNSEVEQNEFEFVNPASIHLFFGKDYTLVKDPPPQPQIKKKKHDKKEEIRYHDLKESFIKKHLFNFKLFLVN